MPQNVVVAADYCAPVHGRGHVPQNLQEAVEECVHEASQFTRDAAHLAL